MARKEARTDLWVWELLQQAGISLDAQGSTVLEIDTALKTASKKGTGRSGFPEYVGTVKDYLLVIEDKADLSRHIKLDDGVISQEVQAVTDYAVNGALFYGKHLAKHTSYKKIIAFGVSGDEKKHRISPIYIDGTELYRELPDVESFVSFNRSNIDEYFVREILRENTDSDKETVEILKDAAALHEDLRNYGSLKDTDKPLIVSGILLALRETEFKNFNIADLTGDTIKTDGQKIYNAIADNLQRASVAPEVKKQKLLSQFALIKDTAKLNTVEPKLQKTPLRHFTEFLHDRIYRSIRYSQSAEDYLGRFYGEFMSYSGGDGQTLGIVLTPKHITELFCDLVDIKPTDVVFDPCCGTAGFLIAAMHKMLQQATTDSERRSIRQRQLHGIELQPYMFTVATTNMILRGDGKSNLVDTDFLKQDSNQLQLKGSTVGLMNPPYSQGSKANPDLYEIAFTEHLLNSLTVGARCAVIVPQSAMTGKSKDEQAIKGNILKHHTLEGVISLNKDTFYGVGTIPCIAVFTAGIPHEADKLCKFISFEDDGYKVAPHVGLVETEAAKDRKAHLLSVWRGEMEAESRFCVYTTVEAADEWLHSFFYFNDEIPTEADFEKTIGDYLTFEFSMVMQGREYLFGEGGDRRNAESSTQPVPLEKKEWATFNLKSLFSVIQRGKRLVREHQQAGAIPYVSSTAMNNGIDGFISADRTAREFSNCLTIANSGSVGSSFYQPFPFIASDHVTHLKNESYTMYVYLFIATMTRRMGEKYNFNREINDHRISKERILLPTTDGEKPDYEYMEQYVKAIMHRKLNAYLGYANSL